MAARWAGSRTKNESGTLNGGAEGSGQRSEQERQVDGKVASGEPNGLSGLQAFACGEKAVRAVEREGQVWFVAQDVCDVLGLANSSQALRKLDESEKGVTESDTLGGVQRMAVINESGALYLILRSHKPEAKAFRLWVTGVVLPTIFRTGSFNGLSQINPSPAHITLPGPSRYIAHMTEAGQVTCVLASNEEAAARIYFAAGRLMAHTLKVIRAHWSIVKQSEVFEDAPRPAPGAAALGRAIAEGDRLATDFLPPWNTAAGSRA